MKLHLKPILLSAGLVLSSAIGVFAQTTEPQATTPPAAHVPNGGDPIRELNLSPEQRERIRVMREQNREERSAVAQRLRESNRLLQEALEIDNPIESVIEQRVKDVAAAQGEAMRLRIMSELKIRQVLTPDQRVLLKTLRDQASTRRQERQMEHLGERQRRMEDRSLRLKERRRMRPPAAQGTPNRPIL